MRIQLHAFGLLKETLASTPCSVELPSGSTVAALLAHLSTLSPSANFQGIAVSVNLEFALATQTLHDGDEVGLLPPVSGGSQQTINSSSEILTLAQTSTTGQTALTLNPIPTSELIALAKAASDGATLIFEGIVRNQTKGRTTLYLDYSAYEAMAAQELQKLAAESLTRFSIRHATIIHRLGRIEIGETSVLILVSSSHRAAAYEASRWLIDTLKSRAPIWKHEHFADGSIWTPGEPFPAALQINPAQNPHPSSDSSSINKKAEASDANPR
jgi:MoaE-MoaD fusion protein